MAVADGAHPVTDLSPSDGAAQLAYASKAPYTGVLAWDAPAPDPTGLRTLGTALLVARLAAYNVTVPGVSDIVAALNDLIAGVEELQRQ